MNELKEIVENELRINDIKIVKWSTNNSGLAFNNSREIKVPKPTNFETLGICFHEIGHIILGHCENSNKKRYIEEYEAEQYAIQKLKEYGYYNKIYEYSAMSFVLMKIAQAKNRGHDIKEVPKEIIKWTGLQINKWKKAKKVHVKVANYKRKQDIIIYFI